MPGSWSTWQVHYTSSLSLSLCKTHSNSVHIIIPFWKCRSKKRKHRSKDSSNEVHDMAWVVQTKFVFLGGMTICRCSSSVDLLISPEIHGVRNKVKFEWKCTCNVLTKTWFWNFSFCPVLWVRVSSRLYMSYDWSLCTHFLNLMLWWSTNPLSCSQDSRATASRGIGLYFHKGTLWRCPTQLEEVILIVKDLNFVLLCGGECWPILEKELQNWMLSLGAHYVVWFWLC